MTNDLVEAALLERVRALEVEFKHATGKLDQMADKVDELHELLLQAKGARWVIIGVAGIAGFLSGKLPGFLALFLTQK